MLPYVRSDSTLLDETSARSVAISVSLSSHPEDFGAKKQGWFAHFTNDDIDYFQAKINEMLTKGLIPGVLLFSADVLNEKIPDAGRSSVWLRPGATGVNCMVRTAWLRDLFAQGDGVRLRGFLSKFRSILQRG
jgi:hypothetical protein